MTVEQLPLFEARTRARRSDPHTSFEAAESLHPAYVRRSQQAVLRFLRDCGPMTDTALVDRYPGDPHQSASGLRTRRSELTAAGLVIDTGQRVRLRSGRRAIVWSVP
jgi:hypothetical protein